MRFEVPQFIEIEDKVFGPFTVRQFFYIVGGIGFAAVLFLIAPLFIFVLLGLPLAGLAAALAFYPINNQPFSYFLQAAIRYFTGTREYTFQQQSDVIYRNDPKDAPSYITPDHSHQPPTDTRNLSSLAKDLELESLRKDF